MKTRKLILLTLALFSAVVAYAQPSTRIDLTQLVAPPDTSKVNFVITEGDTAYYEYQVPSLSFDLTTDEDAVPGMLAWNSDESTLDVGLDNDVILQTGQEMVYNVKNQTGSTIPDGKVVQFAGTLGASGRLLIGLARADTTSEAKYVMGIATADIANGEDGFVTAFGKVRGIDTDGSACGETWADGDILYLSASTAGCLTNVEPTAPALKIPIAAVVNAANNGTLFVRPTFFPSLKDVHDVNISGATDGQVLAYNSTSGVWEPSSAAGGGTGWLKDSLSAGDVSIDANQNDFVITDLNSMQFSVDTFQFLNLNSTLLYPNLGYSSFGNHLTNIREGRLLRWQSDSPFKSRNYLAISEPFDYVTINAGFGIDSLGRAQPGVTTSAPHIAGPQGGLDGYIGYSAADSTISVYYNSQWRPLAWRSQISGGGAGTGWLKDSLEAGDVEIFANGNTLSLRNSSASAGTDSLLILDADLDDETRTNHLLTFRFGGNEAGFTTYDTNFSFYNTVAGEGLSYSSDIFGAIDTSLLKDRQIPDIGTVRRLIGTGGGGVFESVAGVVRSTSANTDDFVFGSSQLNDSGNTAEDPRFFFDKSKAYFFAGSVVGDQADDVNRGFNGSNFGYNHTVSGFAAAAIGGQDGEASGSRSVALGGVSNEAASTNSVAMGDKAKAHLPTTLAHSGGDFRINGDAQYLRIVANGGGFGTAPFNLNINGTGGTRLTVPQNSSWSYSANCLITVIDAGTSSSEKGDSRALHCYGLIQNTNGNIYHSGSTAYAYNDADLDMITAAVTFIGDNTNDALRIAVTPPQGGSGSATSTTWAVCTVEATQIVYDGL